MIRENAISPPREKQTMTFSVFTAHWNAHTPTPWIFTKHGDEFPNFGGIHREWAEGEKLYRTTISVITKYAPAAVNAANAAFIVKAVNSHYQMLEALKVARDTILESFDHIKTTDDQLMADARLADVENAIAAAEART